MRIDATDQGTIVRPLQPSDRLTIRDTQRADRGQEKHAHGSERPDVVKEGASSAKGVLGLIEAGHFRGVADVRLRINFFDQLNERAVAAAAPVVQQETAAFIDSLRANVDGLVASLGISDQETTTKIGELVGEFESTVQAAVDKAGDSGSFDRDLLAQAAQGAFESFVTQLADLLAPTAGTAEPTPGRNDGLTDPGGIDVVDPARSTSDITPESRTPAEPITEVTPVGGEGFADVVVVAPVEPTRGVTPAPTNDTPNETIVSLDDALASLTDVFQTALSDYVASITSATQLADPAESTSHGSAYSKFLAIYNDLRGVHPAVDERA